MCVIKWKSWEAMYELAGIDTCSSLRKFHFSPFVIAGDGFAADAWVKTHAYNIRGYGRACTRKNAP